MLPEISKEIQDQILIRIKGGAFSCQALYWVLQSIYPTGKYLKDYMDSYRLHSQVRSDSSGFKDIDTHRWASMTLQRRIEIRETRMVEWFESIRRTVKGEDDDY